MDALAISIFRYNVGSPITRLEFFAEVEIWEKTEIEIRSVVDSMCFVRQFRRMGREEGKTRIMRINAKIRQRIEKINWWDIVDLNSKQKQNTSKSIVIV